VREDHHVAKRKNRKQIAAWNIVHQNIPPWFEFASVLTVNIGI
jgi:hypothetical protein